MMLLFKKGKVFWYFKHYTKVEFEETKLILLGAMALPKGRHVLPSKRFPGSFTMYLTKPL